MNKEYLNFASGVVELFSSRLFQNAMIFFQWRDHWMQAIFYPASDTEVQLGDGVTVYSCHDDYSLWFDVQKTNG